jgi:anaerobic selenocysteine-containing dehydrogenase
VLSTPNGKQLDKALDNLDFMVSIDIYLNETSKHADVILPPATGLETEHYDLLFNNLAVSNVAKYSPALFKPEAGMRYDWQIFKELSRRFKKRSLMERILFPFLNPAFMLNIGLKKGPYPLDLKKLKNNPHGVDLGPLKPRMPEYLYTRDKKLHLAPALLVEQFEKLNLEVNQPKLVLIGRRELRSNNSWMHNSYRLVKGKNRCTIMMHPDDAESRGIKDNETVKVSSKKGSISLPLEISDNLMPGVVSIPHGYGHNAPETKMEVANAHAGVSINDITDEGFLDALSGNAAFSGVEVEVSN